LPAETRYNDTIIARLRPPRASGHKIQIEF